MTEYGEPTGLLLAEVGVWLAGHGLNPQSVSVSRHSVSAQSLSAFASSDDDFERWSRVLPGDGREYGRRLAYVSGRVVVADRVYEVSAHAPLKVEVPNV